MKFGQSLSVLEAALPENVSAPYREHLTALQDSAPTMATQTVREVLEDALGPDWREEIVWLDGAATAAASIGQVHRARLEGRPRRGRQGAVPRRRRGADGRPPPALPAGQGHRPGVPGHRHRPAGQGAPGPRGRGARLPPRGGGAAGVRRRVRRRPGHPRPERRARHRDRPGHRVDGQHRLPGEGDRRRHPGGARPLRRAAGALHLRRPGPDRDAARRPAPRQLPHPPAARRVARAARSSRLRRRVTAARRHLPAGDGTPPPDGDARATATRCWPGCARRASSGTASASTRGAARLPVAVRGADGPGAVPLHPGLDAWPVRAAQRHQEPGLHAGRQAQPAAVVPPHPPHLARRGGAAEPARGGGAVPVRSSRRACPASST